MNSFQKNDLAALVMVALFVAAGFAIATNTFVGYLAVPVVTYFGGATFAYLKKGKWSWTSGIFWGALGAIFSIVGAIIF